MNPPIYLSIHLLIQSINLSSASALKDYGTADYLRLRVIPVLGTSPSVFGHALASFVLCSLAGKMYEPEVGERMRYSLHVRTAVCMRFEKTSVSPSPS